MTRNKALKITLVSIAVIVVLAAIVLVAVTGLISFRDLARLARLEANVATNAILDHLPGLAIAPEHESIWEDSFILRGLRHLHVTFDSRV